MKFLDLSFIRDGTVYPLYEHLLADEYLSYASNVPKSKSHVSKGFKMILGHNFVRNLLMSLVS